MANVPVKLGRRRIIRVALETTQGSPIAPATVELLCYDAKIQPDDNMIVREPNGEYGGRAVSARGPATCTVTFTAELRGNGGTGLDAGLAVALQGCGIKQTTLVYTPLTDVASQKTITIDVWRDGHYERCYGAMGTFELAGEMGQRAMLNFTFSGLYAELTDEIVPTPSHTAMVPFRMAGGTLTLGTLSPKISRFSLNPNNPVEPREDIDADEGVGHYIIGPGRNWTVGMDPEDPAAATYDFRALWLALETAALSLLLTDGTTNVTIAAPVVQMMPPQEALRDSKLVYELTGQCCSSAGDDEVTITTAAHT
ncbi:MAG TPA: phage tail tube protein [Phycisphaerae bacterium]|nr:phage tail tube protein [Phycisphaerae bacterium]